MIHDLMSCVRYDIAQLRREKIETEAHISKLRGLVTNVSENEFGSFREIVWSDRGITVIPVQFLIQATLDATSP